MEMDKQIFIVHSSKDTKIAELLREALVKMGINQKYIFCSSRSSKQILLGENFILSSKQALEKSDLVIFLISKHFHESYYCINEVKDTWVLDKKCLPIIIDNSCEFAQGFLQNNNSIIWNESIIKSKQILENLNKNLGIRKNSYNLSLLEEIRKFLESRLTPATIENISQFKNLNKKERKVKSKKLNILDNNSPIANTLGERLEFIFNSKIFKEALFDSCGYKFSYDLALIKIGSVLLYYICTRDNKVSYNLLLKIMNDVDIKKNCISKDLIFQALKQINNVEDESTLTQIFIKNIIYDGYVTHAFNPSYYYFIKTNGLGEHMDDMKEKNLNYLSMVIYKNEFLTRQDSAAFYYSYPSANSIHYACAMSPEKVFGGPLKLLSKYTNFDDDIKVDEMVPIIVGESLKHYYKRVGYNNLKITASHKNYFNYFVKRLLKKKIKKLINDFCYDFAYLLLIPINKCQNLFAYVGSVNNTTKPVKLIDYIKNRAKLAGINLQHAHNFDEIYTFFCSITPYKIGQSDKTFMSNLCTTNKISITKDFFFVKIPVYYSYLQAYCKTFKFIKGTKIKTELSPYFKDKKFKVK